MAEDDQVCKYTQIIGIRINFVTPYWRADANHLGEGAAGFGAPEFGRKDLREDAQRARAEG